MSQILSELDLAAVKSAVESAEGVTAGEIVPVIVQRSSVYPVASWRAGGIFALVGWVFILLLGQFYQGWSLAWLFSVGGTGSVTLLFGALGFLLARTVPRLERFFAGVPAIDQAVRDRSMRAFVEEEVFKTRDRTGILIFVSLFERRVEVVGDAGINKHVEPDDWVHVVEDILNGIRKNRMAEGLVAAIQRCGSLLQEKGVHIRDDDSNELSDSVRILPE